jgi:hypothetical protein
MIKFDPLDNCLLLFPVRLPTFSLLLHLLLDDFFEALIGFLFLLIKLFNMAAKLLELAEVRHEV